MDDIEFMLFGGTICIVILYLTIKIIYAIRFGFVADMFVKDRFTEENDLIEYESREDKVVFYAALLSNIFYLIVMIAILYVTVQETVN